MKACPRAKGCTKAEWALEVIATMATIAFDLGLQCLKICWLPCISMQAFFSKAHSSFPFLFLLVVTKCGIHRKPLLLARHAYQWCFLFSAKLTQVFLFLFVLVVTIVAYLGKNFAFTWGDSIHSTLHLSSAILWMGLCCNYKLYLWDRHCSKKTWQFYARQCRNHSR